MPAVPMALMMGMRPERNASRRILADGVPVRAEQQSGLDPSATFLGVTGEVVQGDSDAAHGAAEQHAEQGNSDTGADTRARLE